MQPMLSLIAAHAGVKCVSLIMGWEEEGMYITKTVNHGWAMVDGEKKSLDEFNPIAFRKQFCAPFTKFVREAYRTAEGEVALL